MGGGTERRGPVGVNIQAVNHGIAYPFVNVFKTVSADFRKPRGSRGIDRLWIGTNDMGVFLYENCEFKRFTYEDKTKYLSVRDFVEDTNVETSPVSSFVR